MFLPEKLFYVLATTISMSLAYITMYYISALECYDLDNLNGHLPCKKIRALARVMRYLHGFLACVILMTGHQVLFLFNSPMLALEVYEAYFIRDDNVIFTREEVSRKINASWIHLSFFVVSCGVYSFLQLI